MLSFMRFLRILRTSCFAMLLSVFTLNAYSSNSCIDASETGTVILPTSQTVSGLPTLSELNASGAISMNGNTWLPTDVDLYSQGMEWSVEFDEGTVSGTSVCAKPDWKANTEYTSLTTVNSGCVCTLDKSSFYWLEKINTGADRTEKTENCRSVCPYKCAAAVADPSSSMRDNLINTYMNKHSNVCPVEQSTPPQPTTYTITYDLDGGTGCSTQTYDETESATICTPTREGHSFDGWMDANTSEEYTAGQEVSGLNLDLVAFWTFVGCNDGYYYSNNTCNNSCETNAGNG